jgi:hypothetical protein
MGRWSVLDLRHGAQLIGCRGAETQELQVRHLLERISMPTWIWQPRSWAARRKGMIPASSDLTDERRGSAGGSVPAVWVRGLAEQAGAVKMATASGIVSLKMRGVLPGPWRGSR